MQLTLNQIKKHGPCRLGWNTLLASLNKTHADDDPINIMDILKSNGLDDAVWCLRCCDYIDCCLFLADVAESVLLFFEKTNASLSPRQAIDTIQQYKRDKISQKASQAMIRLANAVAFALTADASPDFTLKIEKIFVKHFKNNSSTSQSQS